MGIGYNPKIVTNGLVLCLDAANRKSYPGSGTSCKDLINSNSYTLDNGINVSANAFVFDGTNDSITLSSISVAANSFTAFCWFRTSVSGDRKIFSISPNYHPIQIISNYMRTCVNGCTQASNTIITDNVWRMCTVIGNGTTTNLYLNANTTPEITQSGTTTVMTGTARLGVVGVGMDSYYFSGSLANFALYNRAITLDEMTQNFNATRGRYGI